MTTKLGAIYNIDMDRIFACLLIAMFAAWWCRQAWRLWFRRPSFDDGMTLGLQMALAGGLLAGLILAVIFAW